MSDVIRPVLSRVVLLWLGFACLLGPIAHAQDALTCERPGERCGEHAGCVLLSPNTRVTPRPTCVCDMGWVGGSCEFACPTTGPKGSRVRPCSGHGTCSVAPSGKGAVCACAPGWAGDTCEIELVTCADDQGVVCSGKGSCEAGRGIQIERCACEDGWTGSRCALRCPGFSDSASAPRPACSGSGTCVVSAGAAACRCDPGHSGKACSTPPVVCSTKSTGCSGHGTCGTVGVEGTPSFAEACQCDPGYRGAHCALECPGFTDPSNVPPKVCSGRGQCLVYAGTQQAYCQCSPDSNAYGAACESMYGSP